MSINKLWTVISGIEYQLNILKDKLKSLDEETKQSIDDAYQRGLKDGKAQSEHWCEGCMYTEMGSDTTICAQCCNAYHNLWQAKIDEEIKVGDEVIYNNTQKCLVVRPETDERYATLIDSNGNHHHACHSECKKTGRHFDIASILKEMQS